MSLIGTKILDFISLKILTNMSRKLRGCVVTLLVGLLISEVISLEHGAFNYYKKYSQVQKLINLNPFLQVNLAEREPVNQDSVSTFISALKRFRI